jgi:hypothetical protein
MRTTLAALAACCVAALLARVPAAGEDRPLVGPPAPPAELKVVRTLDTGEEPVRPFAFSPDGRVLVTAQGKRVRFWDVASGKEVGHAWDAEEFLGKRTGNILSLTFVDSKTVALSAGAELVVHLRSYPDGKEVARLDLDKQPMSHFATAGGLIATESGGLVRAWSSSGGRWAEQWRAKLPESQWRGESIDSLAFSPDRSELAVGTEHGYVHVFRVRDGDLLRSAAPKRLGVSKARVAYSPNGRELAVASGWFRDFERPPYVLGIWDTELKTQRARLRWGRLVSGEPGHAYRCLFTPDGKTLVVPCADKTVRFYEAQTGGLRHVGSVPTWPDSMSLAPDGRLLADWRNEKGRRRMILMDWRATAGMPQPLHAAALDAMWENLASPDSEKGFRAVVALGASPTQAAHLIGEKLRPTAAPKAEAVKGWIADLGSADFATREAAEKELAKLGDVVEVELREAAKSDDPERRARAGRILKAATNRTSPERLRVLRAVEVLEYADTPTGREVLKALAAGAPTSLLTRDAKAALVRLEAFDPKP